MTIPLFVLWTVIVSAFAVLGAYYMRRYGRADAIIALYVICVVFANLTASKPVVFDFGFFEVTATAAVIIFSVTFLLTDIVNEKFGRRETQRMIFIAFVAQIAIVLFSFLTTKATPAAFFQNQAAFEAVFGSVPRIVITSLIAFFVSENVDAYIFQWFRELTKGKKLWMRNVFSTLPSMALDSVLVVVIAFWGVLPIIPLIIGVTVTKWFIAILDIPFMYLARRIMGSHTKAEHNEVPFAYTGI